MWVGRADQVRAVLGAVRTVAAGHGGRVLVEGEPGAGKSALLAVVTDEAARLGCRVLTGAAGELEQPIPLRAVLDCFETDLATGGGGEAAAQVADALTEHLTGLCRTSPVVVVLDNLQWADKASTVVWDRLGRAAGRLPLLLVSARRTGPGGAKGARAVLLGPLTREETAELVGNLIGVPAGPRLLRRMTSAGGNPFYVRELLAALVRARAVETSAGVAELAPQPADAPPLVIRPITEQLGSLQRDTPEVLRIAALLGTDFSVPELAALLGRPPNELRRALDEAQSAGVTEPAGEDPGHLRFRHPVVRESLYASMPASLRPALHRQAAESLAGAGADVRRVAGQLLPARACFDRWCADWLVRNSEALLRRAPAAAVELTRYALDRAPHADPHRPHLEETLTTGTFLLRRPGSAQLVRDLRERTADPGRRESLTLMLVLDLIHEGRAEEALSEVERGERAPGHAGFPGLRAFLLWAVQRYEEADSAAQRIVAPSHAPPHHPLAQAYARYTRAVLMTRPEAGEDALAEVELGLRAARLSEHATDVTVGLTLTGAGLLAAAERVGEARQWVLTARSVAEAAGADGLLPRVDAAAATIDYLTGRWDDALELLGQAREPSADPWVPVSAHGLAALILISRDRRERAKDHLAAVEAVPEGPATPGLQASWLLLARALLAEREGDPYRALALLLPAQATAAGHHLLPDVVRLALAAGDPARARAAAAVLGAEAGQAVAQRCRGLLDNDPEPLLAALAHHERTGPSLHLAQTAEDLAAVLVVRGDAEAARAHLNRAVEVYQGLGAEWFIARADARLRALGVRRGRRGERRRPKSGWGALTPTEVKIALLVAEGRPNPGIAAELLLSPRTVQTHVSHILAKLGLRSRTEIARIAGGHDA